MTALSIYPHGYMLKAAGNCSDRCPNAPGMMVRGPDGDVEAKRRIEEEWVMCSPAVCPRCHKVTYTGCGQHVDQVMASVPVDRRCTCR